MDRRQRPGRHVLFKIKGNDHVGPTLSKDHGDQMTWEAVDGAFTVRFTGGSPFEEEEFRVTPGNPVHSGPVRDNAELRPYEYEVAPDSGPAADPTVFIDK